VRKGLKPLLIGTGMNARLADIIAKAGPVACGCVTTLLAWGLDLGAQGVKLVGDVPQACRRSPCHHSPWICGPA
jgi:SulP family sulfate permease